ncbi:MAG: cystathionine gamma-synthase family protein [Pseudomonadales bacterium]|jgi:O-acetylhomoserine (thiol)-lyase|nr:cystathionine gamma-synthase family protein [Pseudomonadales bacterium]
MSTPHFTTQALHGDRLGAPEHGVLHKPVHNSVAFGYADVRDLVAIFQNRSAGYAYGRQSNPTTDALARKITAMERGLASVPFSTGMAAIGATFLALLRQGDHVVSSAYLFGNTNSLFGTLQNFGIEVSFVDATDAAEVAAALKPNTRLVFVETIANPVTQVADLAGIGTLCAERGLLYVVDNTLTSPWLFQPIDVQASLVINSLTKCIGGHGNALGGSVTATGCYDWSRYPHISDAYKNGDARLWGLTQIRKKGLRDFGAALAPEAAHHLSVGADTLALRVERSCANAQAVAEFCAAHPKVRKVFYPGLPEHPQHQRAKTLFKHYGSLLSIELSAGVDCFDFLNKLELVVSSSHLGDNRSLGIPVAHTIFWEMGAARRASMGVADSLVRLSIGIEDIHDLLADFAQALA